MEMEPARTVGLASARLAQRTGREVVHYVDCMPLGQEPIDERRADEPSPTGDERPVRVFIDLGD